MVRPLKKRIGSRNILDLSELGNTMFGKEDAHVGESRILQEAVEERRIRFESSYVRKVSRLLAQALSRIICQLEKLSS